MVMSSNIVNAVNCRIMVARATSLVLTDISGETNTADITFANTLETARVFGGGGYPWRSGGFKDVTVAFTIYYSTALNEGLELLRTWWLTYPDQVRNIQIDVPDDAVGSDRYTLPCKLSDFKVTLNAGTSAPIQCTGTFMLAGTPTVGTIAT